MWNWYKELKKNKADLKSRYNDLVAISEDILDDLRFFSPKDPTSIIVATMHGRIECFYQKVNIFTHASMNVSFIQYALFGDEIGDMIHDVTERMEVIRSRYTDKCKQIQEPIKHAKVR